jgi:hypothetical protein
MMPEMASPKCLDVADLGHDNLAIGCGGGIALSSLAAFAVLKSRANGRYA